MNQEKAFESHLVEMFPSTKHVSGTRRKIRLILNRIVLSMGRGNVNFFLNSNHTQYGHDCVRAFWKPSHANWVLAGRADGVGCLE